MITKIILNDGTELDNIISAKEIIQNSTQGTMYCFSIDILEKSKAIDLRELENTLNKINALSKIKVYKKDTINIIYNDELGEDEKIFGEEYLYDTYTNYQNVTSIYRNIESDRISISLVSSPSNIADEKYQELLEENDRLEETILEMSIMIGGLTIVY